MSKMTLRATYALDQQTDDRIRQLATDWRVSKAEVIRRSVRQAVETQKQQAPTPAEVVARYRRNPLPRSAAAAREWAKANRNQRHAEDARRTGGAAGS